MLLAIAYTDIIERALLEDLGSGDITTEATVEAGAQAMAIAVARSPLVVCGGDVFCAVFKRLDASIQFESLVEDGQRVERGAHLWKLRGPARAILMGERVALNLTQRMSGVATLTRAFVDALPAGSPTRVVDTRKTTPGLRALERYAVRVGGGRNHRDNLSSAVLIKDNHIVAAGGIESAVKRARERAPHTSRIEIEVANLAELDTALALGCEIIMIDNFSHADMLEAVKRGKGKAILEVSGGVKLDRIRDLASAGVDVISAGALTHSAPAADIALDMELVR
ncbi:MAG: carboxylating nicotinate-nucleotide diphosphorylase [Deltaproteobacteria bacterium]|nr:carboxylating nicotinate-nucleotide diphosphorylase [Deltaproteobacteria bacterium]